ncbi:M61 family metallopeptidase [Mucilaginibacter sp. L3T2-6]|uniref:M61 family metallopeptidase n=1 Tax=Mucilaginibacter sp. L3T2-6 TaxID=3062491 RepID=UPI002675FF29|nr:PDZ domain-containing protein [Mucilaginibacter sp. L3T2-6]MDO3640852.1 PDZ domain-containing protein [Mucilaginibacter sp. L3T2-6]MDV6213672.1 PDZ domain-containing protein [Mucilaginibacter sp. L3T2-6]
MATIYSKFKGRKTSAALLTAAVYFILTCTAFGQKSGQKWHFGISADPAAKKAHVTLELSGKLPDTVVFKMPVWTTGYYQFMNFGKNVSDFIATDESGNELGFKHTDQNTWKVAANHKAVKLKYDVECTRNFVGGNYIDTAHAYFSPAGLFMYQDKNIIQPVSITVNKYPGWTRIAAGLDVAGSDSTQYTAPDFDVLYDAPILMGKLEKLPGFTVKGIPHDFIGYKMAIADKQGFMDDIKKIVENGSAIIGEIPYKHYVFLGLGPGGGGIEHLTSASVAFTGNGLDKQAGKMRLYSFLAHEYFHTYNVKRIRPIELGPFDYEHGSKTEMLWVSEGFTVYYEYMIIRRAGLTNAQELIGQLRGNLLNYEKKPGHLFQSATQASLETWSDGPNGRVADEFNKTISYYDKGPVLGLMLDLKIRHETQNKESLDDVMRTLYYTYFKKLKRGFTPQEFRKVCEETAGVKLDELFEYASTVKEINYHPYFAYAGLDIDDAWKKLPGAWSGITAKTQKDSLFITAVEYDSPAWKSGIRVRNKIISIDGQPATLAALQALSTTKKDGDAVELEVEQKGNLKKVKVIFGTENSRSFEIKQMPGPDALQTAIYKSVFDPK